MMLAVAAATLAQGAVAAAADRFVPADPGFVVADLRAAQPDPELRKLLDEWRATPEEASRTLALASAYLERARATREPRYFGRAESLLAARAVRRDAPAAIRRLYAETLQHRHDFTRAAGLLDGLLLENPLDQDSRLQRAALHLTRGNFASARGDCSQLAAMGGVHAAAGFACLAEALAGGGELERARLLLDAIPEVDDPGAMAYVLATRATLAERAGDLATAIADYRWALRLSPGDDAVRAALADALIAAGDADEAREVLAIEKPSLGLLVRAVPLERGDARHALARRARAWLELETARGDARHDRELALLEMAVGSPPAALAAARRNFEIQREPADVRVLARAAVLAGNLDAQAELRRWLARTGYRDVVVANILGPRHHGTVSP
jgi:thioredoxin-like negative regulator of GroEL